MQGVVGVLISILLQIYRFDRIMVMSLWPIFLRHPVYQYFYSRERNVCLGSRSGLETLECFAAGWENSPGCVLSNTRTQSVECQQKSA